MIDLKNISDSPLIASTDLDGVISSSLLQKYNKCWLNGFYNSYDNLYYQVSKVNNVYVDVFVPKYRSIDQHIITLNCDECSSYVDKHLNPNLIWKRSCENYRQKYPLSTAIFLIALYEHNNIMLDLDIEKNIFDEISLLDMILHTDSTLLISEMYKENCLSWCETLMEYSNKGKYTAIITDKLRSHYDKMKVTKIICDTLRSKYKTDTKQGDGYHKFNPYNLFHQNFINDVFSWFDVTNQINFSELKLFKLKPISEKINKTNIKGIKEGHFFSYAFNYSDNISYSKI